MENKKISWKTNEFKPRHKPAIWYVCFGIISVGLILYAIYIGNILTLITFILLSATAFMLAHQKPDEVTYELGPTGITMGPLTYPYRNIKKFWIIYTPENKTLNFETIAYVNNQISIQLGTQDPMMVKQFLKPYLQEDLDKEESFTDKISRKIRF